MEKNRSNIVDINQIPETGEEITTLAAFADDNLDPNSPEFQKVVLLLRIAERRVEDLKI
jgi:hypothetical protein